MEEKTLNQDQDLAVKNNDANKEPEAPKKKKGLKGFLQLVIFIVLSMAGLSWYAKKFRHCQSLSTI